MKNTYFFIIILILCNILFHFIPFERASLAPDDYASLARNKNISISEIPVNIIKYPDRPLNYLALFLQNKITMDSVSMNFFLLVFSSLLVVLAVFQLLRYFYLDDFTAFIGAVIFLLLPNKLETYHTSIYFNINLVISVYLWSIIFFIKYIKNQKRIFLTIAVFLYTVGIFWYEIGFFMPLFALVYSYLHKKEKTRNVALFFALPFFFYAIYRFTGAFGCSDLSNLSHKFKISFLPFNQIRDLFHQHFGRYMIRNTLYGFYKFLSIEKSWLVFIILADLIFLIFMIMVNRKNKIVNHSGNMLILGSTIFLVFLLPLFINQESRIAGRHLVLPSVGIVMIALDLLKRTRERWRIFFIAFATIFLIICQGNAWTQVIACRINAAVYDSMKENKLEIRKSKNIVIDTKSFADNIPFTWIERDFNVLNTYYGAQTFEDWGLRSMAGLVLEGAESGIYIATENISYRDSDFLVFKVSDYAGYRSIVKRDMTVSRKDAYVIDFKKVYGENFNNGKRDNDE